MRNLDVAASKLEQKERREDTAEDSIRCFEKNVITYGLLMGYFMPPDDGLHSVKTLGLMHHQKHAHLFVFTA